MCCRRVGSSDPVVFLAISLVPKKNNAGPTGLPPSLHPSRVYTWRQCPALTSLGSWALGGMVEEAVTRMGVEDTVAGMGVEDALAGGGG